jgi:hypothetical protein
MEAGMMSRVVRLAVATAVIALAGTAYGWTEPLVTQGIGTSNCGRLAGDLKPGEGLSNPVNLMLVSWVQGYVSAANISLLEEESHHVDMSALDDNKVVNMVLTFCKANPDKKPVAAIDEFLRKSAKVKAKWETGTISWSE